MADNKYLEIKKIAERRILRLPLEGSLDITYRCNNNCRHCWLRIPPDSPERKDELSFLEIRTIFDEAGKMGCRRWSISGGEPMLREDFYEIFDYITRNSISYSINTNGTLITPKIAQLMKRKGVKMIALYGATKEVYEHITRTPGSFEAVMRGFHYLKEAGVGFIVQLIPMRDNYHQFKKMIELAESLSPYLRIGAAWLFLSACGDPAKNKEIIQQRLPTKEVMELDKPDLSYEEWRKQEDSFCQNANEDGYLFSACINSRRKFHIDPYGKMSFCCYIKEPSLRYDLRKGGFKEGWENFIPSLANKIKADREYKENCGACGYRKDCRWCAVYGYLEHRRFSAKVDYLCQVARENRKFKERWKKEHRRYYRIADITLQIDSDLPILDSAFHPKFKLFEVDGPGEDNIFIRHHFFIPEINIQKLGKEMYRRVPWAIYKNNDSWIYLEISSRKTDKGLYRVAVFNSDHSRARIYSDNKDIFLKGNLNSLTLFPTDQILLARILADRQGFYLHSCGVNFKGKGLAFVGRSGAGKSTLANLLKGKAEILCDDRVIIRRREDGFRIYGTWHHGDIPIVSNNSAKLKAIMFLKKADKNFLIKLEDKKEIIRRLLSCLIRPLVTVDWWQKTLILIESISGQIPCYILEFKKSGKIVEVLKEAKDYT
ncbi:MAG: radical SAM protein [Candidatus Omnitrophica bacterium]|nr:radical SAM protein [Candidatus Omnitrophota bacterium]